MSFINAVTEAGKVATAASAVLSEYARAIAQIEHAAPGMRASLREPLVAAERGAAGALRRLHAASYMVIHEAGKARLHLGGALLNAPEALEDAASLCEEGLLRGTGLANWRQVVHGLAGQYCRMARSHAHRAGAAA